MLYRNHSQWASHVDRARVRRNLAASLEAVPGGVSGTVKLDNLNRTRLAATLEAGAYQLNRYSIYNYTFSKSEIVASCGGPVGSLFLKILV